MSNDKVSKRFKQFEIIVEAKLEIIEDTLRELEEQHEEEKQELRKYIEDIEDVIQKQNALYAKKIKELGGEWDE